MDLSNGRNLLVGTAGPAISGVVRFTRPDPRPQARRQRRRRRLRSLQGLEHGGAEHALAPGDAVVFNFALVYWFPTTFFQVLLQVREIVNKRQARLLMCGFVPEVQDSIRLFKGDKIFEIARHTEEQSGSPNSRIGKRSLKRAFTGRCCFSKLTIANLEETDRLFQPSPKLSACERAKPAGVAKPNP